MRNRNPRLLEDMFLAIPIIRRPPASHPTIILDDVLLPVNRHVARDVRVQGDGVLGGAFPLCHVAAPHARCGLDGLVASITATAPKDARV